MPSCRLLQEWPRAVQLRLLLEVGPGITLESLRGFGHNDTYSITGGPYGKVPRHGRAVEWR
jgi:hypothetical protein